MRETLKGKKYDSGKPTPQFIDPMVLMEEGAVMGFGAHKYEEWNYIHGMKFSRLIGAMFRHLLWFSLGVDNDKETQLSHLAHVRACAGMLYAIQRVGSGQDDRLKADPAEVARVYKRLEKAVECWNSVVAIKGGDNSDCANKEQKEDDVV